MDIAHARFFSFLCLLLLLLPACQQEAKIDYGELTTFTEEGFQVVVEIPAGTNHKIEYDAPSGRFLNDQENGQDRIIQFLPYPGNYGYIPGTRMSKAKGGDGDALDVLVLSESLPTGAVVEVKAIAALVLKDDNEWDTKIIAIPQDSTQRVVDIRGFSHFLTEYNAVQTIIKDWFLNYKGIGEMTFVAWQNERFALEEIKKWQIE